MVMLIYTFSEIRLISYSQNTVRYKRKGKAETFSIIISSVGTKILRVFLMTQAHFDLSLVN